MSGALRIPLDDVLTKVMDATLLRTALHRGVFCLYDEASSLRHNAQRRDAISWLRSKDNEHVQSATLAAKSP